MSDLDTSCPECDAPLAREGDHWRCGACGERVDWIATLEVKRDEWNALRAWAERKPIGHVTRVLERHDDGSAIVEMQASSSPLDDLAAILRDLAARDPLGTSPALGTYCTLCGGSSPTREREGFEHEPSCVWVRARAVVGPANDG